MDLQFYGANCVALTHKGTRFIVDDNLADLGAKSVLRTGDVALYTGAHGAPTADVKLAIDYPGEYEVSDISVIGIPVQAHIDEKGQKTATVFKLVTSDLSVLVAGHIYPDLSEKQLEQIGMVDVLFIPVGGSGYTLDPLGALKLIKEIEPKLVIPTHYADKDLKYPVPQTDLKTALHELGMEPKETVTKLRVKPTDLTDITQLIVLEKA
jgi:L-ascorbate metabolism protein UlaG (beta-lactamase superfamily)